MRFIDPMEIEMALLGQCRRQLPKINSPESNRSALAHSLKN
jgi:hypothetical protein